MTAVKKNLVQKEISFELPFFYRNIFLDWYEIWTEGTCIIIYIENRILIAYLVTNSDLVNTIFLLTQIDNISMKMGIIKWVEDT